MSNDIIFSSIKAINSPKIAEDEQAKREQEAIEKDAARDREFRIRVGEARPGDIEMQAEYLRRFKLPEDTGVFNS